MIFLSWFKSQRFAYFWPPFITALHGMQTCLAMRILCVHLSVCQTRGLWQNERKISPDFYTIRKIIYPSFLTKRVIGGATPSTWNFGSTDPHWSEITDSKQIIAHSASVVTPREKSSINTNRKSIMLFPMSQDEHRTLSLSPQRVAQKCKVSKIWTNKLW